MEKKIYSTPQLIVHGDVEEVTLAASEKNADVQGGVDGTAFPPGTPGS